MDKEVEDACSEGDDLFEDSSDEDGKTAPNVTLKRLRESSSEESLSSDVPRGWRGSADRRKRPGSLRQQEEEGGEEEGSCASSSADSCCDDSDDASLDGAADMLEREFLGS